MLREIPYVVMEGVMARAERTIRRLWILCIILIVLFVGTNLAWIIYEHQYQDSVTTVSQDVDTGNGDSTTVIGVGDYGKD